MEKTAVKAFKALEYVCREDQPVGVSQLARELKINRSNAHRILATLVALGYVRQTEASTYAPSLKLWELGLTGRSVNELGRIAKPHLVDLCAATGETVLISVLDGGDTLYLEKQESAQPIRIAATIGSRIPAYCSATGRVLLAYDPGAENRIQDMKLVRFTPQSIGSVKELRGALDEVRRLGFAFSAQGYMAGICALAVPIRGSNGEVVAALGLTSVAQKMSAMTVKRLVSGLKDTAHKIGRDAGYRASGS